MPRAYIIETKNRCPFHQDLSNWTICDHEAFVFGPAATACEGPDSDMCPLPLVTIDASAIDPKDFFDLAWSLKNSGKVKEEWRIAIERWILERSRKGALPDDS